MGLLGNTVPVYLGSATAYLLTPNNSFIWVEHRANQATVSEAQL
jgi:hypothetical protein